MDEFTTINNSENEFRMRDQTGKLLKRSDQRMKGLLKANPLIENATVYTVPEPRGAASHCVVKHENLVEIE